MKIKNLFNKSKNKYEKSKESQLYSEVIYNAEENFLVLFSFTDNFFNEATEFLSFCSFPHRYDSIMVKYVHSAYNDHIKNTDNGSPDTYIVHDRNYILIGGNDEEYSRLIYNSDNLANEFVQQILFNISKYRQISKYENLINNGAMDKKDFFYKSIDPIYDTVFYYMNSEVYTDDYHVIIERLPNAFTTQDILKFIKCYGLRAYPLNAYIILYNAFIKDISEFVFIVYGVLRPMYDALIKNKDTYKNIVGPQYLVADDDTYPGSIDDESLDEIFREKYDRYLNVTNDNNIEYEDIDEVISDEFYDESEDN